MVNRRSHRHSIAFAELKDNINELYKKGDENVKEVDELIKKLAIHIGEIISSDKEREGEVSDKTKALAELISARAMFSVNKVETKVGVKSIAELAESVSTRLPNIPEDQQNIKLSSSEIFRGKQTP